jgi:hypothetical protein
VTSRDPWTCHRSFLLEVESSLHGREVARHTRTSQYKNVSNSPASITGATRDVLSRLAVTMYLPSWPNCAQQRCSMARHDADGCGPGGIRATRGLIGAGRNNERRALMNRASSVPSAVTAEIPGTSVRSPGQLRSTIYRLPSDVQAVCESRTTQRSRDGDSTAPPCVLLGTSITCQLPWESKVFG